MNDPSVRLQFEKCLQTKHTHATHQAMPQRKQPNEHATMKHTHEDPTPYMYDTLQLSFLTTHYESEDDYTDAFPIHSTALYYTEEAS